MTDDFLALTLDVWSIPPESARRVGHPAPFPVELPEQLIRLYTFKNDLVLDPFMGSGSTMVAAAQLDRRYVGFDLDPEYVAIARERVASEGSTQVRGDATERGVSAQKLAEQVVDEAGFSIVASNRRFSEAGVTVSIVAEDRAGSEWYFDVSGAFTSHRGGLQRSDAVWKALGRANALIGALGSNTASRIPNIVLLASHVPKPRSEGDRALRAAGRRAFFDVIGMLGDDGRQRLARYAAADFGSAPLPGFWTKDELLG